MTKDEKELLFQDLCMRLPYGVKINTPRGIYTVDAVSSEGLFSILNDDKTLDDLTSHDRHCWLPITDDYKPFLRPISSMTVKDWIVYHWFEKQGGEILRFKNILKFYGLYHIDYIGLIPMGLALEAPEGMYN